GLTGPEAGLDPKAPYGAFSTRVQAVVDLYGPADLVQRGRDQVMLPGTQADRPDLYKQASPITHARKGKPPVLILHGTKDATVPVEQSQRMAEALTQAGVEHELILVEGAPHSFHLEPKEKDLHPAVIGFFDQHLKPRKGSGAMQLHVNPHELILIGENSFLRLSTDRGQKVSTRCSHWRVLWSPAGAGHVLFVDSGVTAGVRIYADSVPLVRFLQKEIEYLLYKPF